MKTSTQRVDAGMNKYVDEIGRIPLLNTEQEAALAARIKNCDKTARDQMIGSKRDVASRPTGITLVAEAA
jgi:DNA-directed RNA polymerase sigma subunit (sigma70/sigma32)